LIGLLKALSRTLVWKNVIFITNYNSHYGIKFAMRCKLVLDDLVNVTFIDSSISYGHDDQPTIAASATLNVVRDSETPQGTLLQMQKFSNFFSIEFL